MTDDDDDDDDDDAGPNESKSERGLLRESVDVDVVDLMGTSPFTSSTSNVIVTTIGSTTRNQLKREERFISIVNLLSD